MNNGSVTKYAYLGPEGTFSEAALRNVLPPSSGVVHEPFPTVLAALESVRKSDCAAAVVPVENSIKGVVQATLDALSRAGQLRITGEIELPVTFVLIAKPSTTLADVKRVLSHPHALSQCGRWLATRLPDVQVVTADSTAAAAREVAAGADASAAAIAAPTTAEKYGLQVLASKIGERENAITRFVLVSRTSFLPAPSGRDRTSLLVSIGDGSPGALVKILTVLSAQGVNLTGIQSWPTGTRLGSYRFFVDVAGHIEDPQVRKAVAALPSVGARVNFLGTYPRHPEGRPVKVSIRQDGLEMAARFRSNEFQMRSLCAKTKEVLFEH